LSNNLPYHIDAQIGQKIEFTVERWHRLTVLESVGAATRRIESFYRDTEHLRRAEEVLADSPHIGAMADQVYVVTQGDSGYMISSDRVRVDTRFAPPEPEHPCLPFSEPSAKASNQ
jgi:hypothetical protein